MPFWDLPLEMKRRRSRQKRCNARRIRAKVAPPSPTTRLPRVIVARPVLTPRQAVCGCLRRSYRRRFAEAVSPPRRVELSHRPRLGFCLTRFRVSLYRRRRVVVSGDAPRKFLKLISVRPTNDHIVNPVNAIFIDSIQVREVFADARAVLRRRVVDRFAVVSAK